VIREFSNPNVILKLHTFVVLLVLDFLFSCESSYVWLRPQAATFNAYAETPAPVPRGQSEAGASGWALTNAASLLSALTKLRRQDIVPILILAS